MHNTTTSRIPFFWGVLVRFADLMFKQHHPEGCNQTEPVEFQHAIHVILAMSFFRLFRSRSETVR